MKRLAFSDPMMRAIAAGQKTMTRRLIPDVEMGYDGTTYPDWWAVKRRMREGELVAATCAYFSRPDSTIYRFDTRWSECKWSTARIMPAALAPFVLRITEVRAEKLGEIKPSDAVREGMLFLQPEQAVTDTFRAVWEGLYGDGAFERDFNSWVWVYGFEIAERRI